MDLAGIGRTRVALRWVSAAEGQIFADTVADLTKSTRELGPFDPSINGIQLSAVENVLKGSRLRWLTGMDMQITEKGNVYNERIDPELYHAMARQAAEEEYQKQLILESLKDGPQSVREMALRTGLPVHLVSVRLNNLERCGFADLHGYDGSTPKFMRLTA